MPLDQYSLDALASVEQMPLTTATLDEVRNQRAAIIKFDASVEPVHRVEDRTIPGPACEVPVRIYRPQPEEGQPLSVLLYYHGGGFVFWSVETHDSLCRALANMVPCVVVSVDYRLAPEHPFPAAVDDSFAALKWVSENMAALGADLGHIAVAGDSAGGNLAAAVALLAREQKGLNLAAQVLYYPAATYPDPTNPAHSSLVEYSSSLGVLHETDAGFFMYSYFPDKGAITDTRFDLMRADCCGLPPTLLITAECDPIRDLGRCYVKRLQDAGVQFEHRDFLGTFHEFMFWRELPQSKEAFAMTRRVLRQAFGLADA